MRTLRVIMFLTLLAGLAVACGALPQGVTITINNAPTQDVNQIVQATFQAMTQQASNAQPVATQAVQPVSGVTQTVAPTLAPTLPSVAATGSISGTLMYPAGGGGMPSLRIVAFQVGAPNYFHVDTALGQNTYQLDNLPPGTYRVLAYTLAAGVFQPGPIGGYTQMVPCGLQYGCNDHALIDVVVTAGHVTTGVNPNDYYAPAGTFAPNPVP